MKTKLPFPLILLSVAILWALLGGGMVATEVTLPIQPGIASLILVAFSGQDAPTLSHALIGLLLLSAWIPYLLRNKVQQVPVLKLTASLGIFAGVIWVLFGASRFPHASLLGACEWTLYIASFLAAVALSGRKVGPLVLLGAIVLGGTLLGINGVMEYLGNYKTDATWRIFAGWTPNSLASVLIFTSLVTLSLALGTNKKGALVAFAALPQLAALFLTQSKGGLLAWVAAFTILAIGLVVLKAKSSFVRPLSYIGLVGVLLVVLVPAFVSKVPSVATLAQENTVTGSSAISRIANASTTSDQSVGFRKLLWIGAVRLFESNPVGYGLGTYRGFSAQPGLITQTQLAHNTFIQLMMETGVLGLGALIAFLGIWVAAITKGLEWNANGRLRLGLLTAILGVLLHSATESNLYTFGLGFVVFVVLGVTLQLCPDSSSPEVLPLNARAGMTAVALASAIYLFAAGYSDFSLGNVRAAMATGNLEALDSARSTSQTVDPLNPDVWALSATTARDLPSAMEANTKAVEKGPLPKTLRALARLYRNQKNTLKAKETLNKVFEWDPNNLATFEELIDIDLEAGDLPSAAATAKKLVAVEDTTYYQIRSIKEVIPTETFFGRLILSKQEEAPTEKINWLKPALLGYKKYQEITIPQIKRMATLDPNVGYAGETPRKAIKEMERGQEVAKLAAQSYRALGREAEAKEAEGLAAAFEGEASSLRDLK